MNAIAELGEPVRRHAPLHLQHDPACTLRLLRAGGMIAPICAASEVLSLTPAPTSGPQLVGALGMYGCPAMVMALLFFPLISLQFLLAVRLQFRSLIHCLVFGAHLLLLGFGRGLGCVTGYVDACGDAAVRPLRRPGCTHQGEL